MDTRGGSRRDLAGIVLVCSVVALWHVWELSAVWQGWRSGAPDPDPGQHRQRALGALGGFALAAAVPLPLILVRTPDARRLRRGLLWAVWAGLMAIAVWTLVLRGTD